MYVINVINISGGCGKSTTTTNLASSFAKKGYRTLCIDADGQASATDNLADVGVSLSYKELQTLDDMIAPDNSNFFSVLADNLCEEMNRDLSRVLKRPKTIRSAILKTGIENLDLLPASLDLINSSKDLTDDMTRSAVNRLEDAFREIESDYDFVFIDNSPSQNIVSTNTMLVSDFNIIPIKIDRKSIKGMLLTLQSLQTIMENNDRDYDFKILFTMKNRNKNDDKTIEWFKSHIPDLIFDTVIPYQAKPNSDASLMNKLVIDSDSNVGNTYKKLCEELLSIVGR